MEPIAAVQFVLTPDGRLGVKSHGDRLVVLGLLETGRDALKEQWKKQDAGPVIQAAPPELHNRLLNGK